MNSTIPITILIKWLSKLIQQHWNNEERESKKTLLNESKQCNTSGSWISNWTSGWASCFLMDEQNLVYLVYDEMYHMVLTTHSIVCSCYIYIYIHNEDSSRKLSHLHLPQSLRCSAYKRRWNLRTIRILVLYSHFVLLFVCLLLF